MGYYYTTSPENAVSPKSWATPKTHTPGAPVKERGHRYYMPELGRWLGIDPIEEKGFRLVSGKKYPLRQMNNYEFIHNSPIQLIDILGLVVAKEVPRGRVCCGKGCKNAVDGCENWPRVSWECCVDHEIHHQRQLRDSKSKFCKTEKDKKGNDCCPDEGRCSNVNDYPGMSQNDIECPAHKTSLDCCRKAWDKGGLTEQEACDLWSCMFSSYLYRSGGPGRAACPGSDSDDLPPQPSNCDMPTSGSK